MLNISIKTIKHNKQRYSTTGDYYTQGSRDIIAISKVGNTKYESLVAIHELIELILTRANGISEQLITKWDIEHPELDEPGDDIRALYHREHILASKVERMMADAMGIDWDDYNNTLNKLYE